MRIMRTANMRTRRVRGRPFNHTTLRSTHPALRDALILRCVDETLKDPELAAKIDYHARQIIKAIAAKL